MFRDIGNFKTFKEPVVDKKENVIPDMPLSSVGERLLSQFRRKPSSDPIGTITDFLSTVSARGVGSVLGTLSRKKAWFIAFHVRGNFERIIDTISEEGDKRREKIRMEDADFSEVVENLVNLFTELGIREKLVEKARILELGCGSAPTATAISRYFGNDVDWYTGVDLHDEQLQQARSKNTDLQRDARFMFSQHDLQTGFPQVAEPNIVIVRHPNVFWYERAGQETINEVWERTFTSLKSQYPNATILVTTATENEAKKVSEWLNQDYSHNIQYATELTFEQDIVINGNQRRIALPYATIDNFVFCSVPNTQQ